MEAIIVGLNTGLYIKSFLNFFSNCRHFFLAKRRFSNGFSFFLHFRNVCKPESGARFSKASIINRPQSCCCLHASNMIKLSVSETKWSSLLARTRTLILCFSIRMFDFGPQKLPVLSRNGPLDFSNRNWGEINCFLYTIEASCLSFQSVINLFMPLSKNPLPHLWPEISFHWFYNFCQLLQSIWYPKISTWYYLNLWFFFCFLTQ